MYLTIHMVLQPMGDLLIGHPVSMNTFAGHKFSARLHGQVYLSWMKIVVHVDEH